MIVLRGERFTFCLRATTRPEVEEKLGVAFSYPARGWHSYAIAGHTSSLLSAFYSGGTLVAVELYTPQSDRAPQLPAHDLGTLALEPGGVRIGMPFDAVPPPFVRTDSAARLVYDAAFEAQFEGGVAFAMARTGTIVRLALYAQEAAAA